MRINDISTFDSKPVLISQIDEILANKNVTMQGNNVNSPGGLLVLTNEGKIPENTDIQHIFYIGDTFPSADIKKNSLYVSSTGESRATDDNAEYINISLQVVTDFSTVSDDTVATSQAIKTYVDNSIANIATETSGVLSAYATTEYVDNKVANISTDVQHIFYVEDFPEVSSAVANSIYVNKNTKESRIFDGTEFASMSLETVTDFSTVSNDTLATTQAISSFVDEKIAAIDIPDPDLSAYQPISGMSDYALKTDIPEEVVYVDAFPTSGITNAIYVNPEGESKLWNGSEFISMSYEISNNFVGASPSAVASVGAVIDYVSSTVPSILPENITTQGNEFNSGNQLVQLVNGKIPENLYNGDTQHIFYVDEFPESGVENSIYVKNNSETKLYVSGTFVPMSVEVATDILTAAASSIVSVSAMKTYLSGYYADKAYVTDAITSAMLSGKVDLTPYAKTEWVTTELAKKADLSSLVDHIYYVSALPDTSSAISGSIYIISGSTESVYYFTGTEFVSLLLETVTDFSTVTNDTLATTQAISAFVDEKISNIDIPSTDLSNYYNKTESDEKFALKDDVNSKLALSVVEDFPTSGINNTLYVNNENHAQIYANDQWKDIAIEVVENFDTPSQTTVPTTEAVSSFVDEKISNIDIPSTDLSNYYTKTEVDDKFITSANIPDNILLVESVSDFPTSGTNNTMYIADSSEARIYTDGEWKNISIKAVENFDTPNQTTVPTTQAVKEYVETNKLNVNDYNSISKINFTNARVNLESTSGGIVNIDTSMNVENESIDNLGNPLILQGNFIGNSENTVLLYTGDNTETVSNNITTLTNIALNKDYLGDVTSYNTSNILTYDNVPPIYGQNSEGHKSFGMDIYDKEMTIQYTNKFSEYVKVSYWYYISSTATIRSSVYFGLGSRNGASYMGVFYYDVAYKKLRFFTRSDTLSISVDSLEKDKWHYVELCFKLNANNKAKVYHDGTFLGEETSQTSSWNNTDGQIVFRSIIKDAFNFDQLMVNISSEEEYNNFENTEHPIPTSASEVIKSTSFVINETDNVPEDGKLFIKSKNQTYTIQPSLISDLNSLSVDTFNKVKTLSFPNAKTYLDSDDDSKVIVEYPIANAETLGMVKVGDNLTVDDAGILNVNLSNYYTKTDSDNKYALKTEINNPEQKTEVTTNSIAFKKNISIYKIEVANATTFTFDFSQLDENNCYTFELWVSMSTPVTLTFPSEAAWLNDEVPDMSEISTYCIVVRKLPSTMGTSTITSPKALLNLAYQYPLVLG